MPKRGSVNARAQRARRRKASGSTRGNRKNRKNTAAVTARKRKASTRTPSPTVTTKSGFANPFGAVGRAKKKK